MNSKSGNPDAALRALLPADVVLEDIGVRVRAPSLAIYAILERIGSPMLVGGACSTLQAVESCFVLTHEAREVAVLLSPETALRTAALEWADALPPGALGRIQEAAASQVAMVLEVIPPAGPKQSKKKERLALSSS